MKKNNKEVIIQNLVKNINQEISSLEEIYAQIEPLIKTAEEANEEERPFYNRAAGSVLHDFYTGIEKIFCDIANKIDQELPKGMDWHIKLLKNMAEAKEDRTKVVSLELMEELKEYLGFRHLFRNIYGLQLNWEKLKSLLLKIQDNLWVKIKDELGLFIKKLNNQKTKR